MRNDQSKGFLGMSEDTKKKGTDADKAAAKAVRTNEKKWGKPLMEAGWTAFPSIILERQVELNLTAQDINLLLYLATYWWEAENKPHPTKNRIARDIGLTPRTVQRRLTRLVELGYIHREARKNSAGGNLSNIYHFDGLILAAHSHALEKIADIKKKKAEKEQRSKGKKPVLKAIPGGKK